MVLDPRSGLQGGKAEIRGGTLPGDDAPDRVATGRPGRWSGRRRGGCRRAGAGLRLLSLCLASTPVAAAPAAAPPLVTWFGWAAAGLAAILAAALVHIWRLHRRVRQHTAALGASEQRLQLALEAGRIAIWEHDMLTDQVTWWGSVEIIFGQPPETLQERPDFYRAMVPPEELPVIDRALKEAMEGDGRFEVLHRMRWADGSDQWVQARGEVMRDAGGQPVRMAGTVVNVTRQVQTQAELAGARDFLQAIYDASPDMIFVHGDDGRLVEVNDNALQAYGYTREEMLQLPPGTFMCSDCDMEKVQALMQRARAGEAVDVEWTARRRDGSTFPVEVRLRRLAGGNVLALVRDISERREIEAVRQRRQVLLERLDNEVQQILLPVYSLEDFHARVCAGVQALVQADLAAVPVVADDGEGVVYQAAAGEGAGRLRGRRLSLDDTSLCGWVVRHNRVLRVDDLDHDPRVDRELAEALGLSSAILAPVRAGDTVVAGLAAFRRRGRFDEQDMQILHLYAQRVSAALENLQLRLRLEERVAERTQELESFCHSVSHDLRAPLRALDGFSQMLLEDHGHRLDEEGRIHLERIRRAAGRMAQLIDGLLHLSRIGRAELVEEEVQLCRLAAEALGQLQAHEPGRQVLFRCQARTPVVGDRRLLRLMMDNLLGNAWKYTRTREPAEIVLEERREGGEVIYTLRDNGVGFDMRYAHKLFGVFQRLHPASEYEGTGIGLATVQRIIARHGGRIWAHARPGMGAEFHFTLGRQPLQRVTGEASGDAT